MDTSCFDSPMLLASRIGPFEPQDQNLQVDRANVHAAEADVDTLSATPLGDHLPSRSRRSYSAGHRRYRSLSAGEPLINRIECQHRSSSVSLLSRISPAAGPRYMLDSQQLVDRISQKVDCEDEQRVDVRAKSCDHVGPQLHLNLNLSTSPPLSNSAVGLENRATDNMDHDMVSHSFSCGIFLLLSRPELCHETPRNTLINEIDEPPSPSSEAAVSDMLTKVIEDERSTPILEAHASPALDHAAVIKACRSLLAPLLAQNAHRREPEVDIDIAIRRAADVLTDARCMDFVRLAHEVKRQMIDKGKGWAGISKVDAISTSRGNLKNDQESWLGTKRPREEGEEPTEEGELKHRRISLKDTTVEPGQLPESRAQSQGPAIMSADPMIIAAEAFLATITQSPQPPSQILDTGDKAAGYPSLEPHDQPSIHSQQEIKNNATMISSSLSTMSATDFAQQHGPRGVHDAEMKLVSGNPHISFQGNPSPTTFVTLTQSGDDEDIEMIPPTLSRTMQSESQDVTPAVAMPNASMSQPPPQEAYDMEVDPTAVSCPIPGVWNVAEGRPQSDIVELSFYVEDEIALTLRTPDSMASSYASNINLNLVCLTYLCSGPANVLVHLLCLPIMAVAEAYQKLPPGTSPANVAATIWAIDTKWPARGSLVVDVQHDASTTPPWFPEVSPQP